MEILVLLVLMMINGVFAMAEMAIVTSKKVILQEEANKGNTSAARTLELANDPDQFLSTVQVGITLIGIGAGAFGDSAFAKDIAAFIRTELPFLAAQANQIGFGLVVIFTTYLSLVIGELLPKRIALNYSERVAIFITPAMLSLSRITTPIVWLLSASTEFLARILGIQNTQESVSDMEIIAMVQEGVATGEFAPVEHMMVRGVLELDDILVREIMTPRIDMVSLNLQDDTEDLLERVAQEPLTAYPVHDGDIDNIVGIVYSVDILRHLLEEKTIDLRTLVKEAIFVPETAIASNILQYFNYPSKKVIMVIDEYGGIEGLVSEKDIMAEILGHFVTGNTRPVERADGSWLFDGNFALDNIEHYIPDFKYPTIEDTNISKLAGLILVNLGRIAEAGDKIEWNDFSIEVMDVDGKRIDKVLITPPQRPVDKGYDK